MQKDYAKMPKRVSSIATEIESKRILQSEQIKNANMANAYLLYYLSGGNESVIASPKDKVRPEDQDLRGWFAEMYGDKYIQHLTSDLECEKDNPNRVNQIVTDFNANPYGYILRTGAVNDYHIGRIVTCAKDVNIARKEAKKYSKELAILCAKLLLSGEPPNNNIFAIMHSSIRTWYKMQGTEIALTFEDHIAKAPVTGSKASHNHTTYVNQLITSLFDMLAFSKPAESWVTDPAMITAIEALDGVTRADMSGWDNAASAANVRSNELTQLINQAEANGWDETPKMTQELKNSFANSVFVVDYHGYGNTDVTSAIGKKYIPVYQNLAAYQEAMNLAIGAEVPRDLMYNFRLTGLQWIHSTTNGLWYNYDQWQSLKDERTAKELVIQESIMAQQDAEESEKTLAEWHKTPAMMLYNELPNDTKSAWISFVYQSVKVGLGLDYVTNSFEISPGVYSPYPELHIKANSVIPLDIKTVTTTSGTNKPSIILEGFNISRSILLYAKALSGVSPTAYWTASLSHRVLLREQVPTTSLPVRTEVYLYAANMKTGGLASNSNALMAIIKGDKDTALGTISGLLPDIPIYTPGVNVPLTSSLNNAFSLRVSDNPALQQWIRAAAKDRFYYAYAIRSAWDPKYYVNTPSAGQMLSYNPPSQLLGNNSNITHIDWLNATDYADQKFKGVKTLSPNINTLKFGINGFQYPASWPTYFEAKGALSATTMTCVAYPKSAVDKIVEFMEGVPAKIQELLNRVNNKANSPNYDLANSLSPNMLYGNRTTLESTWPQYRDLQGRFMTSNFLNDMEPLRTFLLNRTESLFIDDIGTATKKAYDGLSKNKPPHKKSTSDKGIPYGNLNQYHTHYLTGNFDPSTFGSAYTEYMGLLGAIAYFNSYEMLMDSPSHRNYQEWAKPFKGEVDRVVSSVIASATPIVIYQDAVNDTEDVSMLHQTLKGLNAFEGMTEMPVFDVVDFNIMWTSMGPTPGGATSNPFDSTGFIQVGQDGLKASAYRGLKRGYGDVFHNTIMDACVMRPRVFFNRPPTMTAARGSNPGYMYSSLRVPVNTRGISSKVYGMRTGSSLAFTTGTNSVPGRMTLTGSSGLTYTGLGAMAGVVFAGAIGVAMFKNIASETAFSDKRFRIDDID